MASADRSMELVPSELTPLESETILEIGYLAIRSDGVLTDEEVAAFRHVAAEIAPARWDRIAPGELAARLEMFADALAQTSLEARVVELTRRLERPQTRRYAYAVASALALCDVASNESERAFDMLLARSLGLSEPEADAIAREAYETIFVR